MTTAASSLITEIRRELRDSDDESYSDNMLYDAINSGSRLFALTTGCNQKDENITTGGANSEYSMAIAASGTGPTKEVITVYAVEWDKSRLYWAPRHEAVNWSPTTGTPAGWSYWANTLYLNASCTPSTTTYLTIHYTYAPAAITSGNVDIPDRWMPAIKAYMRYYIHNYNKDEGLAAIAYSEFEAIRLTAAKLYEAQMSGGGYS